MRAVQAMVHCGEMVHVEAMVHAEAMVHVERWSIVERWSMWNQWSSMETMVHYATDGPLWKRWSIVAATGAI